METSREQEPSLRNAYDGSLYTSPSVKEAILKEKRAELEKFNDEALSDGVITEEEIKKAQELSREIEKLEQAEYIAENIEGETALASLDTLSIADLPLVV